MKRESFVDVLKGIAIIFVVITHFSWSAHERLVGLFPFWISMAVPIFMVISGYVSAKSNQRKTYNSLIELYKPCVLICKIIRYTVPFLITVAVNSIVNLILGASSSSVFTVFIELIMYGPGGYYFPVLIQFVFLFPLVYFVVQRYKKIGLLVFLLINAAYEAACWHFGIGSQVYRQLIFRHLFLIAAGCYIGCGYYFNKAISIAMVVLGIFVAYLISYQNISFFLRTDWASVSFLAALFIIPLFSSIMNTGISFKPLELLGKASYNIYLIQMVFYVFASYIYRYFQSRVFCLLLSVLICLSVGVFFYFIETPVTKWIISTIKRKYS